MRAELISLRSRAEGKQSSERLTTSSLWRNTSTLESLISFSCWGSDWILSVCFLKTWLCVFPWEQSTAGRSRCLSRPLVVIGRAVIYHERRWQARDLNHLEGCSITESGLWFLHSTQSLNYCLRVSCTMQLNNKRSPVCRGLPDSVCELCCMSSLHNAVVEQVKHKLKLPLEHTEADDVYNYYQVWFLTLKSEF